MLREVDLDIHAGEVVVLAGENGAGKSTLIKILGSVHGDFEGTIEVAGRAVRPRSPLEAAALGVAIIFQELSLVPSMTVADNRKIYELMNALTSEGVAILLITSELPELLAMSDRILVLHRGRLTAELGREQASPERVLEAAMGGVQDDQRQARHGNPLPIPLPSDGRGCPEGG